MKIPKRLEPLLEDGIIESVIKPLRSGKEADVYVVVASDEVRCAKIYKEKVNRSFHNQVLYQEGRRTKNSRASRAMGKHSRFGKQMEEEAWQHRDLESSCCDGLLECLGQRWAGEFHERRHDDSARQARLQHLDDTQELRGGLGRAASVSQCDDGTMGHSILPDSSVVVCVMRVIACSRQAWHMTAAPTLKISGPYRVGTGPSAAAV